MARLEEICSINMGQSPDSTTYNESGNGMPFFQGNADFGELHPTARIWCNAPTKIANRGDILISVRAPIGALNIANEKCCIGRGLAALTVDNDICHQNYLWYALESKIDVLNSKGTGSTFKAINKKSLAETEIPLPSLDEQRKIAAVLDKVSDLIVKRRQQLDKLDLLVKSQFIEMFGDCRTNSKGWKTIPLDKVSEVGSSKRVFVGELKESGVPFYRGTEIGTLAEDQPVSPELFITEEHYEELCNASGKPEIGDLLMPSICPDGRIWLVNTDNPFYFKDGRVLWVHHISKNFNPVFVLYSLKDRIVSDYSSIASGTTFAELKIFALKKCHIFDVPLELQNQYENFIKQTDKSKLTIQQSLEKLETMKKALLQEYFG